MIYSPGKAYFDRVFGPTYCDEHGLEGCDTCLPVRGVKWPHYCKDCGQEGCRRVSVCCGAEENFDIEGTCPACREFTGFECEEAA